jgi:hypothetical protein
MSMATKIRYVLVACLSLSFALLAQSNPFDKYIGFYVIAGEKPKEFSEFDNFAIIAFDADRLEGRVIPIEGRVYNFQSAKLVDGELQFETRKLNAVSYSFSGRFLTAPPSPVDGHTPVMEGVLKRHKGGVVVAQAKLRFAMTEGGGE